MLGVQFPLNCIIIVTLTKKNMRLIEREMNKAIQNCFYWKKDNTEVIYCAENDTNRVYLHGNHIATIAAEHIELYTCGWYTNTTKSRLNAILSEHGNGARIIQEKGEWYLVENGLKVVFTDGMIIA